MIPITFHWGREMKKWTTLKKHVTPKEIVFLGQFCTKINAVDASPSCKWWHYIIPTV